MSRLQGLRSFWDGLALRERRMLALAGGVFLAALVWGLGIAPALRTLRSAPAQLEKLDRQLQSMQELAAQAKALQNRPTVTRAQALRALELSVQQRLGASAQMSVAAERVTVSLKGAAPDVLTQWLSQARVSARCIATQAGLTRGASGWDGSVVLALPPSS